MSALSDAGTHTYAVIDDLVSEMTDNGGSFFLDDLRRRWKELDPDAWREPVVARQWLTRWMAGAMERKELGFRLRSNGRLRARQYFRLPLEALGRAV